MLITGARIRRNGLRKAAELSADTATIQAAAEKEGEDG